MSERPASLRHTWIRWSVVALLLVVGLVLLLVLGGGSEPLVSIGAESRR